MSRFTKYFRLLRRALSQDPALKRIRVTSFTGNMSAAKRTQTLQQFENDPSNRILLLSLKAGGLGLNLVQATKLVLCEQWWNRAAEEQAIKRIHRIGQTKPVEIVRLSTPCSIDLGIAQVQTRKGLHAAELTSGQSNPGLNKDMVRSIFTIIANQLSGSSGGGSGGGGSSSFTSNDVKQSEGVSSSGGSSTTHANRVPRAPPMAPIPIPIIRKRKRPGAGLGLAKLLSDAKPRSITSANALGLRLTIKS